MKILFVLKHPGYARNLESTLRELGERGHSVHVGVETMSGEGGEAVIEQLTDRYPRFSVGKLPKRQSDRWYGLSRRLRLTIDYLRYLEPRYVAAVRLRERASESAPAPVRRVFDLRITRRPRLIRGLLASLRSLELATPAPGYVDRFIAEQDPDIVLLSPLVGLGSSQADYVRSARKLRIPVGLCVHSWDNLTNKGLMRDAPDLVGVWNQSQLAEAVELHGVPSERVAVTGAVAYDHWFDWSPASDRREFCARVGLDPERPFLLYVGSSRFVGPEESSFVTRWITSLRASGLSQLDGVGVLIRPHPQNAEQWSSWQNPFQNVAVWPRGGENPIDETTRSNYYDSIHHAAAVVGINTSALIEAAIVDRPVHTVLAEDLRDTQGGTLHFGYLLEEAAGPLYTAHSMDEHFRQIADSVEAPSRASARNRMFLETFIRPLGLDKPAAPLLVDTIESIDRYPTPLGQTLQLALLRAGLRPAADRLDRRQRAHDDAVREKKARRLAKERDRGGRLVGKGPPPPPKTKLVIHRQIAAADAHPVADDEQRATPSPEREPTSAPNSPLSSKRPDTGPIDAAKHEVARLAEDDAPILAGPWVSEVGYELLYWIPFLRWALERHPELASRVTVVSRGGAEAWYQALGVGYADLFDLYQPSDLNRLRDEAALRETRGQRKQMVSTAFDDRLARQMAERLGLGRFEVLHPSVMYQAYWQLVKRRALVPPRSDSIFSYAPIRLPEQATLVDRLPASFVAVRFYFSTAFPETVENIRVVTSALEMLTRETEVVMLNPAMRIDDHWDFEAASTHRVHHIDEFMTPTNNLAVQSEAISRSQGFAGTYGGLSYLGPLLGVPALAIYAAGVKVKAHHVELATQLFANPGYGRFVANGADEATTLLAGGLRGWANDKPPAVDSPAPKPTQRKADSPLPSTDAAPARSRDAGVNPVDRARSAVAELAGDSSTQVVAAPWTGDTPGELLYWIPFLTWVTQTHPSLAGRLTITVDTGRSGWYVHLTDDLVELPVDPTNGSRSPAAGELHERLRGAKASLFRGADPVMLDPKLVTDAIEHLIDRSVIAKPKRKGIFAYRPMGRPGPGPADKRLPADFVAVQLGPHLELDELLRQSSLTKAILDPARGMRPMVLLDRRSSSPGNENAASLAELCGEHPSIAVMTSAISRASALVAPPDGFAFLGPQLGVATTTPYRSESDRARIKLAERVFRGPGFGTFRGIRLAPATAIGATADASNGNQDGGGS